MTSLLFACPVCAQQPGSGTSSLLLLAFLAAPFVIAALLVHAVRNADS